jgi:hypothetical protein
MKHKSHREKTESLLDANKEVSIEVKAGEEYIYVLGNRIQGKITT